MKKVLITGVAGFIGSHVAIRLLKEKYEVIGIDNLNDYYSQSLKKDRLNRIEGKKFYFYETSLENSNEINEIFSKHKPDYVINLAAQAGVRYSIENPMAYINSNIVGFMNILEASRHNQVQHLLYASSSSVYGSNERLPFSIKDNVDHPISLYAATKKSNELMAHTYSHLFNLATTGLRFFTVYGPWGRPDMALFLFTDAIVNKKPINVFNNGEMLRDFTYVDDIVESITRLLPNIAKSDENWDGENPNPESSKAPYRIYNIGNNSPVKLLDFIEAIENKLSIKAIKKFLPLQDGDVPKTYADVTELISEINFQPETSIQNGVDKFIDWYLDYYKIDMNGVEGNE
ncbi:NAD-dependent epimerase [Carnobacterium maltaromaticum]|uniref:NAD-dependent epimerase n=1 Tax=Carnobacterium maltaromaticum TaxID=2751 RepID=UPI0039BE3B74